MRLKYYYEFCRLIQDILIIDGCELVEETKNYICIKQVDELIYIPLFLIDYIMILYVKDNKVVDVFKFSYKSARYSAYRFLKFNRERSLEKILKNDSETSF